MTPSAEQRLTRLLDAGHGERLRGSPVGLEKESLRVSDDGGIARTPHPEALGSALTHPWITTDYSEALLELITPPFSDLGAALAFLEDIHRFVYPRIGGELLWAASMPCVLAGEANIPVAWYGTSNRGRMKHVYRLGLGHRYGRMMQVIAGVHFNHSVPEALWPALQDLAGDRRPLQAFVSEGYFGLIRNLLRVGWIVPYLFGAAPAVCKSFLDGKPADLTAFDANTVYAPHGTSLRMSDIGYQNRQECAAGLTVSYAGLEDYVGSLTWAIETPCPAYERIGVAVNGEYRQLNPNILQIENEYYSTVRPKRVTRVNEKPSLALKHRGVQYVELRSLDVNPFDPVGVNLPQLRFLEALMLGCLLADSPRVEADERAAINHNQSLTALRGREPGLRLRRDTGEVALRTWAIEICQALQGICETLDTGDRARPYSRALAAQVEVARDPDRTPSAAVLSAMREHGEGFFQFARRLSMAHRARFQGEGLAPDRLAALEAEARASLLRQAEVEAADDITFEQFLQRYFAQR